MNAGFQAGSSMPSSVVRVGKEPLSPEMREALYERMVRQQPMSVAGRKAVEIPDEELLSQTFVSHIKYRSSDNTFNHPNVYQYLWSRLAEVDPSLTLKVFGEDHDLYGLGKNPLDTRPFLPESAFSNYIGDIGRAFFAGWVIGAVSGWVLTFMSTFRNPAIRDHTNRLYLASYASKRVAFKTSAIMVFTMVPMGYLTDQIHEEVGLSPWALYLLSPFWGTYIARDLARRIPGRLRRPLMLQIGCILLTTTGFLSAVAIYDWRGFDVASSLFPLNLVTATWAKFRDWRIPKKPSPLPDP